MFNECKRQSERALDLDGMKEGGQPGSSTQGQQYTMQIDRRCCTAASP